jgi:ribosomal RNA assembly protein
MIQGKTVVGMGSYRGLEEFRKIVEDCMRNVHPIYNIKTLMIKRELEKDSNLKNEDWDRFLPKFKKNSKKKAPKSTEKKSKDYTPFPPAPVMSKVDIALESGEYFRSEQQKQEQKQTEKIEKQKAVANEKRLKRERLFQPPKEKKKKRAKLEN